jgi:integrase
MAVSTRRVKNKRTSSGELTGASGSVYDVSIKYKRGDENKTYTKKGFATRKDAAQHEAEMRAKLCVASYTPPTAAQRRLTTEEYMNDWIEVHGQANLRTSTYASITHGV